MAGKAKVWVTQSMPTLEVVKGALTECDLAIYTHNLEQPGHMQATINWFATFPQDIENDASYQKTKLTMPVMAIGASNSLGSSVPNQVRRYATNVTSVVFPGSGHWIYEEHPAQSAKLLLAFLGEPSLASVRAGAVDEEHRHGRHDDHAAEQRGERWPLAEEQRAKRDRHHPGDAG